MVWEWKHMHCTTGLALLLRMPYRNSKLWVMLIRCVGSWKSCFSFHAKFFFSFNNKYFSGAKLWSKKLKTMKMSNYWSKKLNLGMTWTIYMFVIDFVCHSVRYFLSMNCWKRDGRFHKIDKLSKFFHSYISNMNIYTIYFSCH